VSTHTTFLPFHKVTFDILKKAIEYTRVVKDEYEIALLRHANKISAVAHQAVLRNVKQAQNERELEALFYATCMKHGAREQAYHPIVAGGTHASTLHYIKNCHHIEVSKTLNLLVDAGGEYSCYCADITRTFPISGEFTRESRNIYDIVLEMQLSCLEMMKPGILWEDVHEHAHKVAIKGLLKLGILKGNPEDILAKRVSVAFFPHGLGHYLGMDTHDTGGNANYEDPDPMFRYLRVRGTLPAGAVITDEPGIYFCRFIIEPYLRDKDLGRYIDETVLAAYWDVGGVRIEG
jgi:Xaa-Pro dipeptidase